MQGDQELEAPQGLPEGEPVAQPDQTDPSTGTDQPAEDTTQAADSPEPDKAEEEKPADEKPEEPKRQPWFVERIARQREQLAQERQQREELAARLARYEQQNQQQLNDPNALRQAPTPEQLQQMVQTEAARIAEQQVLREKLTSFDTTGRKEFPDFVDRCNTLASLGAAENPAFMQIVTDLDDGHRVVAQLAQEPEKAMQVLSLPPLRMAAALAKLSGQAPKPPPVSKAPPPVKPVAGSTRVEGDPDKMSTQDWMKWAEKHLPLR
jgi:hypothetical protein